MTRKIWRLIDVDSTFSLEGDVAEVADQLKADGRVSDGKFYDLRAPSYNQPLLAALVSTSTDYTQNSLFSTVDMLQVDAPDGNSSKFSSHWHIQRNVSRLRFYELLYQENLQPKGLIPTSALLFKDPHEEGEILMRNELLVAKHHKIPLVLSDETGERFKPTYELGSTAHVNAVKSDIFNSCFVLFILCWAAIEGKECLSSEIIMGSIGQQSVLLSNLHTELKMNYNSCSILRSLAGDSAASEVSPEQFISDFNVWVKMTASQGSDYLNNLNDVLVFFNKISWPADKTDPLKRARFFYSGKGHMLAHKLRESGAEDVIQIFDDKCEVIELAKILASDENKHLLGNRKLVALQVDDTRPYHSERFYAHVMWHTGSSLVLNKQEAEFSFLDHNIVVGNYNETPGVIVWKSQNEAEFIAKVEGHHGGSRYVICPLNDQKTTVLYDAKEDNYYRYVASQRDTQYQYVEAIFKNPQNFAPNSLVQRLNRAWDKTFSIPRGPILKSHDRFVHHYLGVPKGGDPWYNKAGYVLGGFIISPVKNFLKLPLEMLPRGMECALEHAIDAVDAKQWPGIVKALIETPLYLGLAAVKTSRLIMRSILSPLETLKEAGAALKRVCHSACESKPNVSGVTSNGLFGGRFCEIGKVLGFMSPQAQM